MLYVLSVILLFLLVFLLPRTKEKSNFIKVLTISIICFFAYNTFICYLLNFINIPITLFSLSIINFVIDGILLFEIIRKKEVQKYKINKRDIIAR